MTVQYNFVMTKLLSRQALLLLQQTRVCHDERFVVTKIFCHDKHDFVATKVLSRQAYFCRGKTLVNAHSPYLLHR